MVSPRSILGVMPKTYLGCPAFDLLVKMQDDAALILCACLMHLNW